MIESSAPDESPVVSDGEEQVTFAPVFASDENDAPEQPGPSVTITQEEYDEHCIAEAALGLQADTVTTELPDTVTTELPEEQPQEPLQRSDRLHDPDDFTPDPQASGSGYSAPFTDLVDTDQADFAFAPKLLEGYEPPSFPDNSLEDFYAYIT